MKIVDLTVPIYDGLQSYHNHPKMTIYDYLTHATSISRFQPPCRGAATKLVIISDHMGTHLDAPFHFIPEGLTIDEVDLETAIGEAIVIDVSDKHNDEPITVAMLEKRLNDTGTIVKEGDIVLVRAWPKEWNAPGFYNVTSIDETAAKWFSAKKIKSLGIDLPNIDTGSDLRRPCHMELLGKGIGIMENIANLDKLSKTRFFFIGLPLKIQGLSGSPIRAVAIEEW